MNLILIDLDALPHYEGAIIPRDGYGIYGVRENVVKLDDLMNAKQCNCENCRLSKESPVGGHMYYCGDIGAYRIGEPDFCCKNWTPKEEL